MIDDPFSTPRETSGTLSCPFQGESITMLLRHADVRAAARDWQTFSSDAPFRVPIPSEEDVRSVRQLPIETDPPQHGEYRDIVEPFFSRPKDPAFIAAITSLIDAALTQACTIDSIEIVRDFALPLQSQALTHLLGLDISEAQRWISWGIHVFRDGSSKGQQLEDYLRERLAHAVAHPGNDFFSALHAASYQGRSLTLEEKLGFGNLTFAGGRDTIIHMIACAMHYLAENPPALSWLREDPRRIIHAAEELLRVFMPLTHIGRICPNETSVADTTIPAQSRVSLCWAAANFDPQAFPSPNQIHLDRKPNPHLSFGFGTHLCLGAAHARLILRTLLRLCAEKLDHLHIIAAEPRIEKEAAYQRTLGFESLHLRLQTREVAREKTT